MVLVVKKLARACSLPYPLVANLRGVCFCMPSHPYMATKGGAHAVDALMGETLVDCVLSNWQGGWRRDQRRFSRVACTRGEMP
jgi:hypothetical protein